MKSTRACGQPGWRRLWAGAIAGALLLAACGGGVGTGGTGSFASGPITGFGSVIVNDIVFDDSAAAVQDGDGNSRARADLGLGMTVEIDGGAIQAASAKASLVRFDSALVGPVETVNVAAGSFTLLGQVVTVDDTTVFDAPLAGRLALLVPGRVVEVYALFDAASQRYRATRVEPRAGAAPYRLRGIVTQVDAAGQALRIGNGWFAYVGAAALPSDLAPGQFVRLALRTIPLAGGRWAVASFSPALRALPELETTVIKGLVNSVAGSASFQVDGRAVDASAAQFTGGALVLGSRVEVEGVVRGGVLRASRVGLRSDDEERERGFELHGMIESVDPVQRSFVLRGLTIGTSRSDLRYENGGAADLEAPRRVEVKGQLAANGAGIEATRIRFK